MSLKSDRDFIAWGEFKKEGEALQERLQGDDKERKFIQEHGLDVRSTYCASNETCTCSASVFVVKATRLEMSKPINQAADGQAMVVGWGSITEEKNQERKHKLETQERSFKEASKAADKAAATAESAREQAEIRSVRLRSNISESVRRENDAMQGADDRVNNAIDFSQDERAGGGGEEAQLGETELAGADDTDQEGYMSSSRSPRSRHTYGGGSLIAMYAAKQAESAATEMRIKAKEKEGTVKLDMKEKTIPDLVGFRQDQAKADADHVKAEAATLSYKMRGDICGNFQLMSDGVIRAAMAEFRFEVADELAETRQ